MNHTGVNTYGLSQVVRDEANRFLDAVEIGTDEEFVVCATEILSQHEFESKGYCRVPCTIGKVYIKQYLPRNHHKIYRLAYMTTLDANGNERHPLCGNNYAIWQGSVNKNWERIPSPEFDNDSWVYLFNDCGGNNRIVINAIEYDRRVVVVRYECPTDSD